VTSIPDVVGVPNLATLLQGNLPALTALPSTLNWGRVQVGSVVPGSFNLLNTGNETFDLSNISITGANAGDFSVGSNNCVALAANKSCTVNLSFSPSQTGTRNAAANVLRNTAPLAVPVTGTGTSSSATLSPPTLSFPSQFVGTSGLPQNAQLTNFTITTITITSVAVGPSDFAALSTCGNSLAPGASCSIGVFFDPTAGGTRNGTPTVVDSAGNSPQVITLTGNGEDFSMASSGSSTATVSPGGTAKYTIAIAPAGGFKQTVSFTCSGAPAGFVCSAPGSGHAQRFFANHGHGHRGQRNLGALGATWWLLASGEQACDVAGFRWFAGASDLGWCERWAASHPSDTLRIGVRVPVLSFNRVDRM
jgi:hypothetical protein